MTDPQVKDVLDKSVELPESDDTQMSDDEARLYLEMAVDHISHSARPPAHFASSIKLIWQCRGRHRAGRAGGGQVEATRQRKE